MKMNWQIGIVEGKLELSTEEILKFWPQLNMARRMLSKLPEGNGQRRMFEAQANTAITSLAKTKDGFREVFEGPLSKAFVEKFRPTLSEEAQAFVDAGRAGEGKDSMEVDKSQTENQKETEEKAKQELVKQQFFDDMYANRDYIIIVGAFTSLTDGADATLPVIKYNFRV